MLDHLIPHRGRGRHLRAREGVQGARHDAALGARATRVEENDDGSLLVYEIRRAEPAVEADLMLVATGRVANVEDLGLEAAGVQGRSATSPSTCTCARTSATSTRSATSRALAARAHGLPRGRGRGRERARARGRDRRPLDAALHLHRPGGRIRRPHRRPRRASARRRCRGRDDAVRGHRTRGDVRRPHRAS